MPIEFGDEFAPQVEQSMELSEPGALDLPAPHGVQASTVGEATSLYVLAGHAWQMAPVQYWPTPHGEHTRSLVVLGAMLWYVRVGHAGVQLVHEDWFCVVLNVPLSHATQVRFSVAEAAGVPTCSPAAQFFHGAQVLRLGALVNVPIAQVTQVRLAVGLPSVRICEPGGQLLHAAHDRALVAVVNVPAAQFEQVRLVVALPSLITNVPAAQSRLSTHWLAGF
ncbi:MAG TPA: hypothetical protein VI299_17740 [Polyangiales bacterium]